MEIATDCEKIHAKRPPKIITKSVKECLQPQTMTRFQSLMTEIRSKIILKNQLNEIGKANYKVSSLPPDVDPIWTTFGTAARDPCKTADVIHGEYINYLDSDVKRTDPPGEQINRGYKEPFNKHDSFGKSFKRDIGGSRAKKLIHWFVPRESQSKYYTTTYQDSMKICK